jgi:hypothetical protein
MPDQPLDDYLARGPWYLCEATSAIRAGSKRRCVLCDNLLIREGAMKSQQVLLAVVVAAAAGAVLGVLFAPSKYSGMGKRMGQRGTNSVEFDSEEFGEFASAETEEYNALKEGTRAWVERQKENATPAF